MSALTNFYREIPPLSAGDSFLVFDRTKDNFDFPVHYHPEFEINFIKNGKGVKRVVGDNIEEIDEVSWVDSPVTLIARANLGQYRNPSSLMIHLQRSFILI